MNLNNQQIAISSKGLSKQYQLGGAEQHYESFQAMLKGLAFAPFRKMRTLSGNVEEEQALFWALKDIDFEIPVGQITGVIGRNGAGKSTLLKVLSRITAPTEGEVNIRGRVASLLEVGSGFHPELTGRENIYMNASILGMPKAEVTKKLDLIVAFAEVEKFIDTPVKRYSSGMYVRLAFSVAAHVDPDVLLVDEVLAVGDAKFQQRCIGRLSEVSQQGRTVLFVSHNMGLIQDLCSHSIYLKNGSVERYGLTSDVLPDYLNEGAESQSIWQAKSSENTIRQVEIVDESGERLPSLAYNETAFINISYCPDRKDSDFVLAVRVTDELGRDVFTSWDTDSMKRETKVGTQTLIKCHLPNKLLRPGRYYLTVLMRKSKHSYIESIEEATLQFEVTNIGFIINNDRFGVVLPELKWSEVKP